MSGDGSLLGQVADMWAADNCRMAKEASPMNDRDQLAELVDSAYNQCINTRPIRSPYQAIADAVLREGWRPPAQVIETPEGELEKARARIAELEAALEAKCEQHAETLGYLEHAYRVIDQQVRQSVRETHRFERLIGSLWKSRRHWQQGRTRLLEATTERTGE